MDYQIEFQIFSSTLHTHNGHGSPILSRYMGHVWTLDRAKGVVRLWKHKNKTHRKILILIGLFTHMCMCVSVCVPTHARKHAHTDHDHHTHYTHTTSACGLPLLNIGFPKPPNRVLSLPHPLLATCFMSLYACFKVSTRSLLQDFTALLVIAPTTCVTCPLPF